MNDQHYQPTLNSRVESVALEASGYDLLYQPTERMGVIIVNNFPALGKLAALRFLEWVQQNPEGVISLPTGKSPEHFIKNVQRYLNNWQTPAITTELENSGIDPAVKPEMRGLRFVQIDEFYPINPLQHNSFHYYVRKYYIKGFNFDEQRALLIDPSQIGLKDGEHLRDVFPNETVDLSLRTRRAKNLQEKRQQQVLMAVDQFCTEYETKVRELGGIGFFLGGIGPDGHIGFNIRGSDHYSTTRLCPTNYETQAAAAGDLGGIEVSANKLVITIGLATITYNPQATTILIAAGEAKAGVVHHAIEHPPANLYPATVLHQLPNARCYLTRGAASQLSERRYVDFTQETPKSQATIDRVVQDLALHYDKPLLQLKSHEAETDRFVNTMLKESPQSIENFACEVRSRLVKHIQNGLDEPGNEVFLHTAPHHDDIMLGYLPYVTNLLRNPNHIHVFTYLTSGFTAVTNKYAAEVVRLTLKHIHEGNFVALKDQGYFDPTNKSAAVDETFLYLDGLARNHHEKTQEATARRFLRNCIITFEEDNINNLNNRLTELQSYLETQYPGKKDLPYIQQLKGMLREWEAETLWGYYGFTGDSVRHLRLGFYQGDIFTEDPTMERDVTPILALLRELHPTTITVALDPEGSGPDTHYKVLQAVATALKTYLDESTSTRPMRVIGYRNVWYRFHPSETNMIVPISQSKLVDLQSAFLNCFVSQRDASFPSYEYDGPFSRLAQRIQVKQYEYIKTMLGADFFQKHQDSRIRAARACVFLKSMTPGEFFEQCRMLRQFAEDR